MNRPPRFGGRAFLKIILREVRGNPGRFLAIFAITALGVGFLAGLLATTPDMKLSVDRYFDQTAMMDLFVKSTSGITAADAEAVGALAEVAALQRAYVTDALVKTSRNETLAGRIYGLPLEELGGGAGAGAGEKPGGPFINRPELLSGRLPVRDDECLVLAEGGFFVPLPPGTVLSILDGDGEDSPYALTEFTVTGVVKSPLFISFEREGATVGNGRLAQVIYVREGAYSLPVWTDLYILLKGAAELNGFSPAYEKLVHAGAEQVRSVGAGRVILRREEILAEARRRIREELEAAEAAYGQAAEAARAELDAGREKLDAGRAEVEAGRQALSEGELLLGQGRERLGEEAEKAGRELAANEGLLREGEAAVREAKTSLAENKALLDAAREEVEKTRASRLKMFIPKARAGVASYDEGLKAWEMGARLVAEKEDELRQGRLLLESGRREAEAELAAAAAELLAAETEIDRNRLRLEAAERELALGERSFEAGRAEAEARLRSGAEELAAGRRRGREAEQEIGELFPLPEWYVLDRGANVGAATYRVNAEKIASVAAVFPVFFLLVAALVVLTTMTRMIEEERGRIGILKALGYRKRAIAGMYLASSGLISILASAAGMGAGFQLLPIVIYNAFGTRYRLPPLVTGFNWPFGLAASAVMLSCTMGVSIAAVYGTLREKPAELMRQRAPKAGKRIFLEYLPALWGRLKFTHKVSARNLLRYKKHFFMTVTGIAGCTALMVAGFGLKDSITDIARTQFTQILKYDLWVELREALPPGGEIPALPGEESRLPVKSGAGILESEKSRERISASLCVPQDTAALGEYISLRDRRTGRPLPFSETSVLVTEKMAAALGVRAGDPLILEHSGGRRGRLVLSGVTENYVGNYIYLGEEAWRAAFPEEGLSHASLLLKTGGEPGEAVLTEILANEAVTGLEVKSQVQGSFSNLLSSIGFVVLILIGAAAGLAAIVLYNLTGININERRRELATLRVLGFRQREAAAYIFREIRVLVLAGTLAGLALGIPLHRFIIGVAENVDLMFGRRIAPASFLFSAALTLLFSTVVNRAMGGRIRRINMADSLKAAE